MSDYNMLFEIIFTSIYGSHLLEYDCKSLSIISDVTLPRKSLLNGKPAPKNKLPKMPDMLNRKQQGYNVFSFILLYVSY